LRKIKIKTAILTELLLKNTVLKLIFAQKALFNVYSLNKAKGKVINEKYDMRT
jgi:hypothetical protein